MGSNRAEVIELQLILYLLILHTHILIHITMYIICHISN